MSERGLEQLNNLSEEQQEKIDGFLEEVRPTIEAFIYSDKSTESDYRYEIGQIIEKFRRKNHDIPVNEIVTGIKNIENDIEQIKIEQLKFIDEEAA